MKRLQRNLMLRWSAVVPLSLPSQDGTFQREGGVEVNELCERLSSD